MPVVDTIIAAINARRSVTAIWKGRERLISPHAIGRDDHGHLKMVAYQYGGYSSSRLPPGGEWRCFRVDDLTSVSVNSDPWHTNPIEHSRPNSCVTRALAVAR